VKLTRSQAFHALLIGVIRLIKGSPHPWIGASVYKCFPPLFRGDRTGIYRRFVAFARGEARLGLEAESCKGILQHVA
jgi:hypothetical protein